MKRLNIFQLCFRYPREGKLLNIVKIEVGDTLTMKKAHPCGCSDFAVLRTGADIRIKCIKCGRDMILPREKVEKSIKTVKSHDKQ